VTALALRLSGLSLLVATASALWPARAAEQASPQQPQMFRGGIELVSMNVTVAEGTRYVTDLEQTEFQVFEDGVAQEITFFNRSNLPIALSLLLDTSASMEDRLSTAQEAAIGFARHLRARDLASIVDFDTRAIVLQPFTGEVPLLEQAIRRTAAGGSTALYNAIYTALKGLQAIPSVTADDQIRRQAIVLLSDGEDTSSLVTYDDVLDLAKRSSTTIYAIGLRDASEGGGRGFNEAEFVLRQLSQETGGRAFLPNHINELDGIYTQIANELSSQYTLGYTPRNTRADGTFRRLQVRVQRPGLTARTRQGYFAPTRR
jgi:Ca-activated chloride channel family protein